MPRGKKKIEPGTTGRMVGVTLDDTDSPATTTSTPLAPEITEIHIYDEADRLVRTYSVTDHGEGFATLADSFLAGNPKCRKT